LTKSQTFIPDWPELGNIRAKYGPKWEKIWFSRAESGIILFLCTDATS